jgi:predicted acyltransferase (DUF342 family)
VKKRNISLIGVLASVGILASAGLSASAETSNTFSLLAGGGVTTGALNNLSGDIGARGAVTTGAGTTVDGDLYAGAAITTGAGTSVYGDLYAGDAITTGAGTHVSGTFIAGSAIVLGAGTSGVNPPLLGADTIAMGNAEAEDINLNLYTSQMAASIIELEGYMARGATEVITDRELGGKVLTPGVYTTGTFFTLSGTLTLDGENNVDSEFIIRTPKYISASAGGSVKLINGASAENVFFVTGSYFSAGAGAKVQGNIMATSYATLGAGSTFGGNIFSKDGYITLGANVWEVEGVSSAPISPIPLGTD